MIPAYLREDIVIPHVVNAPATGVDIKLFRLSDGFWLDFNDMTFKNSGWNTDLVAMSSDDNYTWTYAWTTPQSKDKYMAVHIESGFQTKGEIVVVSGNLGFTVQTDGGNSATTFKTDLIETVDDHFKDPCLVKFIKSTGLKGQTRKLKATGGYTGATKNLTVEQGFTGTPADGDKGIIINE